MIAIRLVGILFLVAAWLLYRGIRRAVHRGHIGSARRRVVREARPWRFRLALTVEVFGAVVCFAAAYLCLTHSVSHF